MPVHCSDQRHLGLCFCYVAALAYGSCRVSDQGTTLGASNLHNSLAPIINPSTRLINSAKSRVSEGVMIPARLCIALKFDRRLSNVAAESPDKLQSDILAHEAHNLLDFAISHHTSTNLVHTGLMSGSYSFPLIWRDKRKTDNHSSLSRVSHLLCTA